MEKFTTVCPRNCYSTCGLTVTVNNGKLRAIEGHKGNEATSEGPCLKGLSYIERVYSPDRIITPLKKVGDTNFEPISWDTAIELISKRLSNYRDEFGAQSVLYYAASGTKGLMNEVSMNFWKLYGGCTITYGDLCWPAGLEAGRLTFGDNKHNVPWDIANAKLIVLWGKNSAETNIHQTVFINNALENEGKLIVIDPRRTQTAERADLFLQPRPGTDGALAMCLANLIIEREYENKEFIRDNVIGFNEYAEKVKEFTPEKVSEITDVPVESILNAAKLMGTIKPMTIACGYGMQRYTNSGQSMRAIIALLALTGNIGKSGAGWQFANLQSHIFDDVKDPIACYPPEKESNGIRVSISTALLGRAMLETRNPELKMAWIERGNPVTQNPETNTVLEAFRKLEFKVVVDQFLTDTAREADIILPAKTMFEQTDVVGAYWHPYIQMKQKVIEPVGQVKPESEIYYALAKKLGYAESDFEGSIPEPTDAAVTKFIEDKLERFPTLSLEKLKEAPILAPGNEEVVWKDLKFNTPSGKIELSSAEAEERWGSDRLPGYREPIESINNESAESRKFPLYFLTPNTKNRIHSQFNNLEMIRQVSEKPYVHINFLDAESRKIRNGDSVKVHNDRGELNLEAKIDFSMKKGCVSVTNGWWISEGGTVNFLSKARETDMGHGAAFHDNLVEVEKIS